MRINHSASCVGPGDHAALLPAFTHNFVGADLVSAKVESRLAALYGCDFARLTNSGSNALLVALRVLQRRYPDRTEVLVSGYVCTAVVNVIMALGLSPVFVDVNMDDLNIDDADAQSRITASTLALTLTNLGGYPDRLSKDPGVPVILDACQSIGTRVHGDLVPGDPAFVIFSFGPTKPLTGGLGGALLTNDPELHEIVSFFTRGEHAPDSYVARGYEPTYDYDLSALNILLIDRQLDRLEEFLDRRHSVAARYTAALRESGLPTAPSAAGVEPNHYRYYLLTPDAERIVDGLQARGVDARRSIAHNFGAYGVGNAPELPRLRVTPRLVVSLPIHPALDDSQVRYVIEQLRVVAAELRS